MPPLLLLMLPLLVFLCGCLSVDKMTYRFDCATGVLEVDYQDIRSQKEKDNPAQLEKDWQSVKEALEKKDDFSPDVASVQSKELFKKGSALWGKAVYQVGCPTCFSSELDILRALYSDGRWEIINDEIFLVVPHNIPLVASNGTMTKTPKSNISVWPLGTKKFEFTLAYGKTGQSLLRKYLADKKQHEAAQKHQ